MERVGEFIQMILFKQFGRMRFITIIYLSIAVFLVTATVYFAQTYSALQAWTYRVAHPGGVHFEDHERICQYTSILYVFPVLGLLLGAIGIVRKKYTLVTILSVCLYAISFLILIGYLLLWMGQTTPIVNLRGVQW